MTGEVLDTRHDPRPSQQDRVPQRDGSEAGVVSALPTSGGIGFTAGELTLRIAVKSSHNQLK